MARRLDDVRLAVLMLDGIELKGRTNIVCLGITTDGVKVPLGLWEGLTENATVATALLSDLVERGLDPEQGMLFVIDGSKALRKAIRDVFGEAPVQRCIRHKERNVLEHLPEGDRAAVKRRLRQAWALEDHDQAIDRLHALAVELERSHPGAAGSLREQALAVGRDGFALDGGRDARGRAAVSQDHRLPRPRQARPRDRTRPRSYDPRRVPDRGGRRSPEASTGGCSRSRYGGGGDRVV